MRTGFISKTIVAATLVALSCCGPWGATACGQAVPAERRITHREQSLSVYDPFSADEIFKHIEIPPSPALPPEEALKSFQAAPGFRIECVAAEPLVVDPVMFEFDADGRIWVVEMRGWMQDLQGSGEADPIGQVVVLEDTDGDSFMDRSTVFLDQLVMPRTVSFVDGGVLVAEPPNLWFCRDVDGDLKCDEKRLVGPYGQPGNPEHTDNGLMHALDNWMYNAKSTVRHKFHDGKLTTEPTVFRGQWGVTQDDYGRLFYGYENSSLHCDLIPADYVERNAHARAGQRNYTAALNVSLTAEAHEVFPIRVNPGITLGGTELREDGTLRTFTIACGPSIYRGDQFPPEFYGGAVIPEAGGNLVRLDKLSGDGVHLAAHNAFEQRELVASTDERFRPVCSRTGPDGAVYICDLYRGIIEHVIFMMPYLRNQILSRGLETPIGMGRIYRIVHEDRPLGPPPQMSGESSAQLVERLSHPNGWWRDTAQRLLVERQAVDAVPALRELARGGESDLGRVHALWTLEGLGQLDWPSIQAGLSASDARLRSTAIRLSERMRDGVDAQESFSRLQPLFDDERPMVQLQLLLTLAGYTTAGQTIEVGGVAESAEEQMAVILVAHPDPVFRAAAVSGLQGRELEMLRRLQASDRWTGEHEDGCGAVDMLAMCVVHEAVPKRVERLLELAALSAADKAWFSQAIVGGILASNLNRQRWPEPIELSTRPRLLSLLPESAEALQRILTWPGDDTLRQQRPIPEPLTPVQEKRLVIGQEVYNATCYSCHKADGRGYPGLAPSLVESEWVNGSPEHLIRIVLHGLQGPVKVNGEEWNLQMPGLGDSPVLNDERMASVLTYTRRAWGNYGSAIEPLQVAAERQATSQRTMPWTVDELLDSQQPLTSSTVAASDPLERYHALLADGDAERGRFLFHSNRALRCNACHIIGDQGGGFVGPNLSQVGKRSDREHLLESLVVPSAKIAQGFETLVVVTGDGRIVSGTLAADDGKTLVLAPPAGGTVEIAAADIEERIQSSVSSMPPVGETFTPQQIADLVAYLETLKADEAPTEEAAVELLPVVGPQAIEDLTVLDGGSPSARRWIDWSDPGLMLVHHLNGLTRACLTAREGEINNLKSAEDWKKRQAEVRQTLDQILGPWPARSPLNARVTGILRKDGYRVEKIVFESMPGFHVTGALFIPVGHSGRGPAILNVIGHSTQAFRRDIYQNVILNLVHKGFVVFTIDPLGQGERLQYFDPQDGKSSVGSSTQEHSHAGVQCFLTGRSIARYFTWDGIRAIDYLLTRPEVDPNRIGATGLSGGGTQSSYIGAIDQRVLAVAPTGFITSISRLLGSIGPQDAEQVFYHGPLLGIDHADLLEVRAPKPTLQVTTTRDFFSIQGGRETAAEVRQIFEILGHPEHFDQVEDDYEHGFTKKNNEATYAFFQKFLDLPGSAQETAYPFLTEEELTVTETGQVSTSLQSETVFSINRQEARPLLKELEDGRQELSQHLPRTVLEAEQLSGYRKPQRTMAPVFQGQYQRDGYRVEKWGLPGEGQTVIPTLVFAPDDPTAQATTRANARPAIIYAHDKGKAIDAAVGGTIEALVRSGYIVAAPDLLGYGETTYKLTQGHAPLQPFFNALMSGRSVAGINAGDAVRVLEFLQNRDDVKPDEIGAVAFGDVAPALLHATAFEQQIRWLVLVESLLDYQSIVMHQHYNVNANSLVAGALTAYDLPDLLASIAPRRVALLQPRTHVRTAATRDEITSSLGFVERHAQNKLRVESQELDLEQLIHWCVR